MAAGCGRTQNAETDSTKTGSAVREGTEANSPGAETIETETTETEAAEAKGDEVKSTGAEALSDGTYTPTLFTVSGGTGKVTITCPEVTVSGGSAEARISFSSPHYEWVRVDGVQYDPENKEEKDRKTSEFRIPVRLDEEFGITGLTTAMSEPHEIEYTLRISLTETESPQDAEEGSGKDTETSEEAPGEEEEEDSLPGAAGAGSPVSDQGSSEPPALPGLTFVSAMEKQYAETFDIYSYQAAGAGTEKKGLYYLIDVHDSARYLLVPEGGPRAQDKELRDILAEVPEPVTVLQAPLDNIYVAATSSMALFDAAGAIGQVKLTGTKADGWYIDAPKRALADGSMVYAGKYSAPDYELLASSACSLAVESMMILHTPEVKEKLEELGIPVLIDTSSRESHPLGRTEWVRLYGVLTGHEQEAEDFFEKQKEEFAEAEEYTETGKTVAFFSITSSGSVVVRASDDYIPRMIGLAGGTYIFEDLVNESGNSASVRLSMEDFYNTAKDADYLIYNATIENPVANIGELCGRSSLLADFKAVQEGNVWQVRRSLYQSPDIAAQMITDIHRMLTGENGDGMVFLDRVR